MRDFKTISEKLTEVAKELGAKSDSIQITVTKGKETKRLLAGILVYSVQIGDEKLVDVEEVTLTFLVRTAK